MNDADIKKNSQRWNSLSMDTHPWQRRCRACL